MTTRIATSILLITLLSGCKAAPTPGALPPPEGDLAYLLGMDPAAVTSAELLAKVEEAEVRASQYHVVEGIYWPAVRSNASSPPDLYGSGGDSLLFTGNYVASCAYRYGVTKSSADLDRALNALRGLYILTHISGTPGVMMRCAFPTANPGPWGYPGSWQGRINSSGLVYDSPTDVDDPFNPGTKLPQMTFYTRVTRDQVTGLVYGMSVFWQVITPDIAASPADRAKVESSRLILAQMADDVYGQLRAHDWKIRDQTGRNDSGADTISEDLLRLSLFSLYRHTVHLTGDANRAARIQEKYEALLWYIRALGGFPSDPFNAFSNGQQYYAWNLRFTRAGALWLNASVADRPMISDYIHRVMFKWVKGHKNAWFSLIYGMTTSPLNRGVVDGAVLALKSWSLRPVVGWPSPLALGWDSGYQEPNVVERISGLADGKVIWPHLRKPTGYWTWQKDPWDAGATAPTPADDTGTLDLLLPYWMARFYGLLR